jgi:hypothetical protein
MQGIFVNGYARPKSKKAVREAIESDPSSVTAEATSLFGNEYGGPISGMADGSSIHFVGPDPYTKRSFYGTVTRSGDTFKVR